MTDTSPSRSDGPGTDASVASSKRPAPRGTASYPRKRGNTACQVCRARRTKCDNGIPSCSFCTKIGATCIRSPVDLSSFDPASIQILERIEDLSQQFRTWTAEQSTLRGNHDQNPSARELLSSGPSASSSWLFPPRAEEVLPQDVTKPHLLALLKASTGNTPGVLSVNSPISSFADLETQSVNTLIDGFFEYVHVKNPILDEHEIRRLASRIVLHGIDWSPESCLLLIVCALGTLATPLNATVGATVDSSTYYKAHTFFLAAQKRLGSCLVENGLIQAQCLFLAGVFLMTVFKPLQAWRMFSQSLACCQDFTFLTETNSAEYGIRNTEWSSRMVSEQAVYWSAWKSEQEVRLDLRPPDFCSQESARVEFPKFFPVPPSPTETDTSRHIRAWTFYLTEISLRRHSLLLAEDISETMVQQSHLEITRLMQVLPSRIENIEDWQKAIPQPMSLDSPSEEDDICKFVIRGHILNLYEMLYWPFLGVFIDFDNNSQRETLLREIAMGTQYTQIKSLAEKALAYHVERVYVNIPGFFHRHHGTWFMIRTCSRSATVLLRTVVYNTKVTNEHEMLALPTNWRDAVLRVIELHRYWKSEVPDAAFRLNVLEDLIAQVDTQ